MTTNQRIVLAHFSRIGAGSIFHDRRKVWVWASDVREDAKLADEIVSDRAADMRKESDVETKKRKLDEWKSDAAARCYHATGKFEQDAAYANFERAKAAYEEHCREFGLVAYATYDD